MWHCTCFLSLACLFTVHMGSGPFPHLWSFPPSATFTSFPSPGCWARAVAPAFHLGLPLLPSSVLRAPRPLCYMSFFFVILYYSFFFSFFPGWESVCPGGYADLAQGCLWEDCVPLSSPCGPHLPKWSGHWCLAVAGEPSWFLRLMLSGDDMRGLEVWRSQSFASFQWFFL
jgi:hypothetical protein